MSQFVTQVKKFKGTMEPVGWLGGQFVLDLKKHFDLVFSQVHSTKFLTLLFWTIFEESTLTIEIHSSKFLSYIAVQGVFGRQLKYIFASFTRHSFRKRKVLTTQSLDERVPVFMDSDTNLIQASLP